MQDVATTKRKPLTKTQRRTMWETHGGICIICKLPIDPRKVWIDEHIRALGLGGTNDLSNRGPAHFECAEVKTAMQDMPAIVKAKRQKDAHLGIKDETRAKIPSRRAEPKERRFDRTALPPRALYQDTKEAS